MKKRSSLKICWYALLLTLVFVTLSLTLHNAIAYGDSWIDSDFLDRNEVVVEIPHFRGTVSNQEGVLHRQIIRSPDGSVLQFSAGFESFTARLNDAQGNLVYYEQIQFELPLFGAFYSGTNYNFVAFGQSNPDQSTAIEVYRIVKYDKSWNRIAALSLYGTQNDFNSMNAGNTTGPFSAATPRFVQHENTLIFHTGRTMFTSPRDGLRHQAALYIFIDISTMQVAAGRAPWVSHSFNQFPLFDGGTPVFLDHGDAFPRTITIWRDGVRAVMLDIPGAIGDNWTGVAMGGFEMSTQNFITAVNITHGFEPANSSQRDIYTLVLRRGFTSEDVAQRVRIATFFGTDRVASTPNLVRVGHDSFVILWQEFEFDAGWLGRSLGFAAQRIDGNGRAVGTYARFDSLNQMLAEILSYEHFYLPVSLSLQIGNPEIIINGNIEHIDPGFGTSPILVNGNTLVPIRAVAEALGAEVIWRPDNLGGEVHIERENIRIILSVADSPQSARGRTVRIEDMSNSRNNRSFGIDVAALTIGGRTMVPLRVVSEALDAQVHWNGSTQTINISGYLSIMSQ